MALIHFYSWGFCSEKINMLKLDWHTFIWKFVNLTHVYSNLYSILMCKKSKKKLFSSSYPSGKTGSRLKKTGWGLRKNRMRLGKKQLTSCQLFFLGLILPFPSPLPVFPEPLPVYPQGFELWKSFSKLCLPFRKKITSVGKLEEKGKMGPAQDKT